MSVLVKQGWSVSIRRKNGTEFLAFGGEGVLPAVWPRTSQQRKWAVRFKDALIREGFDARVVTVHYSDPDIIVEPNTSRAGGLRADEHDQATTSGHNTNSPAAPARVGAAGDRP